MSLSFGLNVKKPGPPPNKRPRWAEEEDDEDENVEQEIGEYSIASAPAPKYGLNVPSKTKSETKPQARPQDANRPRPASKITHATAKHIEAAQEADASIFDYDSFHDAKASVVEAKKTAARQDAIERKPKYINNLLESAARRKQDQQVAQEKLLQREREAEGDEFADKEKFVTGAYKQQQEETRRLQEEEAKKAELEEERRRRNGGGLQSFHRNALDERNRMHQETIEAAAIASKQGFVRREAEHVKSDAQMAKEMQAKGVNVHLNEEGQLVDKRELLTAGLNVAPSGSSGKDNADHLKASSRPKHAGLNRRDYASERAQGERQRKMIEEQMEESAKRKREENEEQRAKEEQEAKSKKTDKDVSDAKARFLARKAARERGEG